MTPSPVLSSAAKTRIRLPETWSMRRMPPRALKRGSISFSLPLMARIGESGSVINCANRATDVSILDWLATPVPVPPESPSDKFMPSPFLCQAYTKSTWEARGRVRNTRNRGDTWKTTGDVETSFTLHVAVQNGPGDGGGFHRREIVETSGLEESIRVCRQSPRIPGLRICA